MAEGIGLWSFGWSSLAVYRRLGSMGVMSNMFIVIPTFVNLLFASCFILSSL